ncbi:MAG TPA: hypothetical protein VFS23_41035 [Vicinamibacterales bacterium]|nr:hypothetical protein [Vicinamibacterales bacterium]
MIRSHLSRAVLLTMGLAGVEVRAQVAPVLGVNDGVRTQPIARVVNGRWVADGKCVAAGASDSRTRERLEAEGAVQVSEVRAVAPGSPEWLRLSPTIVELFERREREQRLSDRVSDAPRAVDWIYASDRGESRTYYFEASRRVASNSPDIDDDTDPPGTVRIAVAGFLHDAAGRLTPLGTKSELRWEQDGLPAGPNRPDLTPLGVVIHDARSIWVMKGQSGTSVWFTLYDVSTGGTRTLLTARPARC